MNVQSIREDGVAIVRTDGYINNLGAERIEQECDGLIQHGYKKIVINFAKSPIINSMGLSILIGIIERMLEINGVLAFSDLTPVNAETMEIMGLTQYAKIYRTEGDAREGLLAAAV
jgi:anti-anti-sigma factor